MNQAGWKAPYLPYNDIRVYANDFLKRYNSNDDIPVPIEEIIEFQLKIDIVPIPSFRTLFNMDAFISNNFREIKIDAELSDKFEFRYLFTLAHEIGHMILHKHLYESVIFSSIEEWQSLIKNFDEQQYCYCEKQADHFAGLILVPELHLREKYQNEVERLRASTNDINISPDTFNKYAANPLHKKFKVASETMIIRMERDNLKP